MRYTVLMLAMFCCGCQKGDQKVVVTQEAAASKDSEELKSILEEAVANKSYQGETHRINAPLMAEWGALPTSRYILHGDVSVK